MRVVRDKERKGSLEESHLYNPSSVSTLIFTEVSAISLSLVEEVQRTNDETGGLGFRGKEIFPDFFVSPRKDGNGT